MSRVKCVVLFSFLAVGFIFSSNTVLAGGCKDITGEWELTGEEVCAIASPTTTYEYRDVALTFEIVDQEGCRFYGTLQLGEESYPLTGSLLKKNEIVVTVYDATFRGKLAGKKKMTLSFSDPADSPTIEQCTGNATAERISGL